MNDIQMDKMEGKTFLVHMADRPSDEWASNDEEKFSWGCGPAGDLMIFRSRYHAAFSARLEKDVRWYLYAPGTWERVEVLDAAEEGTFELSEEVALLVEDA